MPELAQLRSVQRPELRSQPEESLRPGPVGAGQPVRGPGCEDGPLQRGDLPGGLRVTVPAGLAA
ncbi:hypothetical protein [Streptomyces sp. NPDC058953]|uniref:hypothetical protein n=1 Tax=unclassified Streptomyces TaxID=2593676 RepID=UPI0036A205D6